MRREDYTPHWWWPPSGKIGTRVRNMSKSTDKVKALFHLPRPVTREDAAEIADWVNKGGTFDPNGPPPIIDDEREAK
jgi:hypothetical protein